ncbi:hypothetical protein VN97_g3491 [Penicillium thymicola]|uniref:Uncharacterized protein n=1 Tax=Penicillium thymicola TaxID=293382 RepID=A0AAI9TN48_PENTH|nr:hypothetical protein VN97_g3491 [Penicillium thymicola]
MMNPRDINRDPSNQLTSALSAFLLLFPSMRESEVHPSIHLYNLFLSSLFFNLGPVLPFPPFIKHSSRGLPSLKTSPPSLRFNTPPRIPLPKGS